MKNSGRSEPSVAIVIVSVDAEKYLDACLKTMLAQSYENFEIVVVDNQFQGSAKDWLGSKYPMVRVIDTDSLLGYRTGNRLGTGQVDTDYLVISNEDVEVERDWLSEMVREMEASPDVGMVAPKILLHSNQRAINVAGNTLHYLGLYGSRGCGRPAEEFDQPEDLAAVSGCCFMIRTALYRELGGFSDAFDRLDTGHHASFEDVDLGWRVQLKGYRLRYVPSSVMFHKWTRRNFSSGWYGTFEFGRAMVLLRNYEVKTLLTLAPALLGVEVASLGVAAFRGREYVRAKLSVLGWLLSHSGEIRDMRHNVQKKRLVRDSVIISRMSAEIALDRATEGIPGGAILARVANRISGGYLKAAVTASRTLEGLTSKNSASGING